MKILLIFIAINCCIDCFSQELQPTLTFQQELLQCEYNVWVSNETDAKNTYIFKKAQLLKQHSFFKDALRELKRIKNDSIIDYSVDYEIALNSYLINDINSSYNTLYNIPDSIKLNNQSYLFLLLLVLNESEKWEELKKIFDTDSLIKDRGYNNIPTNFDSKSPILASDLSKFLPGLGQIYTQNYFKGVISFSLVAGFIGLGFYQYIAGNYIIATVGGVYPALRFYSGGKHYSYNLALKYNLFKEEQTKKRFREIILKYYCF